MAEFRGLEAAENGVEDFRNGLVIPPQTDEKYPGQSELFILL